MPGAERVVQPRRPLVEGGQRGGGVEQHRVADRPALPGQHPPEDVGVERRRRRRAARPGRTPGCPAPPGPAGRARPRRRGPPTPTTSSPSSARRGRRRRGRPARGRRGRRAPRPAPAPSGRSAQPIAAATGRAGLVSGPRKLKTVPMPISRARARRRAACPGGTPARRRSRCRPPATHRATRRGRQVDDDAERLEHVGRPGGRRRGPVAVLGDRHARRRR